MLEEALSQGQLERVLIQALRGLDEAGVERLAEALDDDSASVVQEVLRPPGRVGKGKNKAKPGPTAGKLRQEWEKAWAAWDEVIENTGDEEGPYVESADWDGPYVSTTAIEEDLEAAAIRFEALLPAAQKQAIDPEFRFLEHLMESDDQVGDGIPDWMDTGDQISVGPTFTRCLLTWDWACAQEEGLSLAGFASDLCTETLSLERTRLDEDTLVAFFRGFDRARQKGLQEGLQKSKNKPPWSKVLADPHSCWFSLYRELCSDFAREEFLVICRENIAEDWSLALPVVDELSKKGEDAEVILAIQAALRAMGYGPRGQGKSKGWDPTGELFDELREEGGYPSETGRPALQFLERWEKSARKLGQEKVAAALGVQIVLARHWQDGPATLSALRALGPAHSAMREHLFTLWKERFVQHSLPTVGRNAGWNWVGALIDDIWQKGHAKPGFRQQLAGWLAGLRGAREFRAAAGPLAMLLVESDSAGLLSQEAPRLAKQLASWSEGHEAGRRTRRAWLAERGVSADVPAMMELWRKLLYVLIPDPSKATGSHYEDSVKWLGFVRDLNRAKYDEIIAAWAVTHKARRNLWSTIRTRRLPLSAGR